MSATGAAAEPGYSFDATPGQAAEDRRPDPLRHRARAEPGAPHPRRRRGRRYRGARADRAARAQRREHDAHVGHHRQRGAERRDRARCRRRDRDAHLPAAARRRPPQAAHRLHRADQHVRPRPVLRRLPDRQGQQADDLEPPRARRCPPHLSVLGRARLQGDLRADRDGAALVPGGQQHAGGEGGAGHADPEAGLVPADAENVELSVRARRRRARAAHGASRRRRDQRRDHDRQAAAGPLRARQRGRSAALLQRLFRREISAAQARPDRGSGRLRRRHGELGRHHLLREPAAVRSGVERSRRPARHFQHPRPRDGASMVRQSRHHGLVGQSLAQRGLRHLDASQGRRAFPSAVADLAQQQRPEAIRHEPGRAALLAPDPAAGRQRDRGDGGVRRHHLQQGAGADPHARALSRRGRVPRRHPQIHGRPRLRQHHHRRSVAGAGGGLRQAGGDHRRAPSPSRPACRWWSPR